MNKFKITDWTLILFQGLFVLWRLFYNSRTVYDINTRLKSPFIPEVLFKDMARPYYIMIGFFVIVSVVTGMVIKKYSRKRILILIVSTLILEYILATYLWRKP